MKTRHLFLSIALVFLLLLFSASKKPKIENYQTIIPPGTMEVAVNLYCDETEATNQYWLDYLHWISVVYGSDSKEYKSAMPDTAVWKEIYPDSTAQLYGKLYFPYPVFRNYPVVGVSQQQAKEYAKWRSDRVMEQILINMGVLELQMPTKENHFTIERFFNGQIPKLKDVIIDYYPEYRLPNLQERQYVVTYIDYLYHNYKKKKKCTNAYPDIWSLSSLGEKNGFMQAVNSSCNPYMRHLRGNVAEWLDEPHIAAGGSWQDKLEDILASDTSYCEKANVWTGFRNVCQWKKWGE